MIKPNLSAPYSSSHSVDRRVIASVVKLGREAGAKRVTVIEVYSVGTLMKREAVQNRMWISRGYKTVRLCE